MSFLCWSYSRSEGAASAVSPLVNTHDCSMLKKKIQGLKIGWQDMRISEEFHPLAARPIAWSSVGIGLSYPVFWVPHYQRRVSSNLGPYSNPFQRCWGREGWLRQAHRIPLRDWDLGSGLLLPTSQGSGGAIRALSLRCHCRAWPSFEPWFPFTRSSCSVILIWKLASSHWGHMSYTGRGLAKSIQFV